MKTKLSLVMDDGRVTAGTVIDADLTWIASDSWEQRNWLHFPDRYHPSELYDIQLTFEDGTVTRYRPM